MEKKTGRQSLNSSSLPLMYVHLNLWLTEIGNLHSRNYATIRTSLLCTSPLCLDIYTVHSPWPTKTIYHDGLFVMHICPFTGSWLLLIKGTHLTRYAVVWPLEPTFCCHLLLQQKSWKLFSKWKVESSGPDKARSKAYGYSSIQGIWYSKEEVFNTYTSPLYWHSNTHRVHLLYAVNGTAGMLHEQLWGNVRSNGPNIAQHICTIKVDYTYIILSVLSRYTYFRA